MKNIKNYPHYFVIMSLLMSSSSGIAARYGEAYSQGWNNDELYPQEQERSREGPHGTFNYPRKRDDSHSRGEERRDLPQKGWSRDRDRDWRSFEAPLASMDYSLSTGVNINDLPRSNLLGKHRREEEPRSHDKTSPAKRFKRENSTLPWENICTCFNRLNKMSTFEAIRGWLDNFTPRIAMDERGKIADFQINNISIARCITALGQKVSNKKGAEKKALKANLQRYFKENPTFMENWQACAKKMIRNNAFDKQGLSNIMHAHGLLGTPMDDPLYTAWEAAALKNMGSFNEQSLSNIMYAHGLLGTPMGDELYTAWKAATLKKMNSFTEQHLSNIMYAHGLLEMPMGDELYTAWKTAALKKMGSFTKQGLSNIMYAHGLLGTPMNRELYRAWRDAALKNMGSFNEQNLSNIMYAHGLLGTPMGDELYTAWKAATLKKMNSFTEQHLSNIMYAHGLLGTPMGDKLYTAWKAATLKNRGSFNEQEISNIMYAFALLQREEDIVENFATYIGQNRHLSFNAEVLHSLYCVWLYYKHVLGKTILEEDHLKTQFEEATLKWRAQKTSSSLQKDVARILKHASRLSFEEEFWCDRLQTPIDIVLWLQTMDDEESPLYIQVDGPTHYYNGNGELNSSTRLQNLLLERMEIPFIRIPYTEWNERKNDKAKIGYLRRKILENLVSDRPEEVIYLDRW